ncbi:PREDICTED: uncharacterized protein LOC101301486 [Fragaria vesca subsp. vesca]|uniref:uncharacterized protein LOC101301486 n=1 Tax=Fragaria vesca subsp. vesca TaxID=101020 RepID=UPI0002C36E95|nr:PREDICTED: uncharacterized protein LOC101301486 [Fragaria vesca subsp. vesca]
MNLLNDAFPFVASGYQQNVVYDNALDTFPNVSHVDYNSDYDKYTRLVREVQTPLYPGSKHTLLGTVMEQMTIKNKQGKTNACFDEDIALIKKVLPKCNSCPEKFDQVKRMLANLGLDHQKIDACVNNCILYYKDNKDEVECPHFYEPRYEASTSSKQKKPIPRKVLHYFPLGPRLQRLYMSSHTTKHMRWHQVRHQGEQRIDPDNLTHPANGEAWQHFDRSFPKFAGDCRNVRLGLATDEFNPIGNMNLSYSIWPVIVFPYNLPPNMCMRKEYNFLTLMVPGPCSLGKCLDVYMRPLIDELQELWENRLPTFDRHGQTSFMMKAAVIFTISDFPAYGMLFGQQTKRYKACPVCIDDVNSTWHANKFCFLGSRRHLDEDHEWRWDTEAFDGTEEHNLEPRGRSGEWILERLNQHWFGYLSTSIEAIDLNPPTPDEFKYWTHKSVFFGLPYWSTLKIRHNLDVMHIEKNVCDSVLGTIMNLKHKNKDTPKACVDLKKMGICPQLWLVQNKRTKKAIMPKASYTVHPQKKAKVFQWFGNVKYPHGYSDVVDTLVALSKFFQRICAKELKKSDVRSLQEDIVYIMCKLEKIFPPTFYNIIIHLMIHLLEQVLLTGPVQYTWCYPNESQLRDFKKKNKNKRFPEGSITAAYIQAECVTYCSAYLNDEDTVGESSEAGSSQQFNLSVVSNDVQPYGRLSNSKRLSNAEIKEAHWCVLQHCEEAELYLKSY